MSEKPAHQISPLPQKKALRKFFNSRSYGPYLDRKGRRVERWRAGAAKPKR